jgi:hypothetical protein
MANELAVERPTCPASPHLLGDFLKIATYNVNGIISPPADPPEMVEGG